MTWTWSTWPPARADCWWRWSRPQADRRRQATLNYDVSMEDYFRHDWSAECGDRGPAGRAASPGWTYFAINGHMGGQPVSRLRPAALRGGRGRGPRPVAATDGGR